MFHTAIKPSLPVLSTCLSSPENATVVIGPECALQSIMNCPEEKSYKRNTPAAPPTAKYLFEFEIATEFNSSVSPLYGLLSKIASAFIFLKSQYVIFLS